MMQPGYFPAILDALRLIHQCQTPVVAAADVVETASASATAARPKRSPYKPVSEQPAQPARRQRKSAASALRQRLDMEAVGLIAQMEEDGGLEAYLATSLVRISQLGDSSAAECSKQAEPSPEQ
eukprot:3094091-Pleurochrysis_carterae.AAC.1